MAALHERQPFASATQAWSCPPLHWVTPAAAHWLLHVPQLAGSAQKPSGQALGALHARQPLASATQV